MDTLVGTAGNDTFNANALTTSLSSGDSVDGGAGNDTLNIAVVAGVNASLTGVTVQNVETVKITGSDFIGINAADAAKLAAQAAAVTAKAATAANLTAAGTVATAATVTANAAAAKLTGLNSLKTDIGALATTGATLETDIAALTATAQAAGFISSTEKAAIDLPVGIVNTNAQVDPLITTATSAKTSADAASTAATAAVTTAATADATAAINLTAANTAAAGITVQATINAAQFVGSNAIVIDGNATEVTGLTTQTVTQSGSAINNKVGYATTVAEGTVILSNSKGTLAFNADASNTNTALATVSVNGSVRAATAATTTANAVAGTVTLVDHASGSDTGDTIKTVKLNLTNAAVVDVAGLTKVTAIDASGSTGNVELANNLATTLSIKTGSGNDKVTFNAATDANVAAQAAATLNTGAGNDAIIVNVSGTGTALVEAGDGDDTITMTSALNARTTIKGGAGADTIVVGNATFTAGDYVLLASQVSEVETLKMSAASTLDASKVAQFTGLSFAGGGSLTNDSTVTKVANAQAITATADVIATAAGYIALGTAEATAASLTATKYDGALAVKASGGTAFNNDASQVDLVVNATSVSLNVVVSKTGDLTNAASFVTLTGDVKTATINTTNGVDNTKLASADVVTNVKMTIATTKVDGNFTALGNLESVTLTGNGNVIIDNANAGNATKLATIDASALGGTFTVGTNAGKAVGGLNYTANTAVSESIKLGSGLDIVTTVSTYDKMDTITGFKLVANVLGNTLNAAASDKLTITGNTDFARVVTGLTGSTIDAVLTSAAASAVDKMVFQFGGDTYAYVDTGANNVLDNNDIVVKLVGAVDLDLLVASLNIAQ